MEKESSSLLLGVMSGSSRRRAAARCVYGRVQWPTSMLLHSLNPVRVLFVVGNNSEVRTNANDELHVPVNEPRVVTQSFSAGGTVAIILKVVYFLQHAAHQPESAVAIADDDTFIALPHLHGIAAATQRYRFWYAGRFEWYNMIPRSLAATGWGSGPQMAAYHGHLMANCSAKPGHLGSYPPKT